MEACGKAVVRFQLAGHNRALDSATKHGPHSLFDWISGRADRFSAL